MPERNTTTGQFELSDPMELFNQKWIADPVTGCWQWQAGVFARTGYAMFCSRAMIKSGTIRGNRAAWLLYRGPIPKGMHVCHKCDNRLCVNPDHLFLGTHQDNMTDRNRKGRTSHDGRPSETMVGEKNVRAILNVHKVLSIRHKLDRGFKAIDLAAEYKVHPATITAIKKRRIWTHV